MKKLFSKFFDLSLLKQLVFLLGVILLFILFVINPYVENKINHIVENQIFDSLLSQQNQLISMVEDIDDWAYQDRFTQDKQFDPKNHSKHMLYYNDTLELLTSLKDEPVLYYADVFSEIVDLMESEDIHLLKNVVDEEGFPKIYYLIQESPSIDGVYWISFEQNDPLNEVSNALLESIQIELIYLLYIVIVVVALSLILWIYSVILPLKKIVGYIQSIQKKEDIPFSINRNDEVGEVGKALIHMNNELKKEKDIQENLIHNISHDLKTPITIIKTYAQSMKDDIYPYGDKDSSLDIIIDNGDRLEKKVKDFLLINRLDFLKNQERTDELTPMHIILETIVKEMKPLNPSLEFHLTLEETSYIGEYDHWYSCLMNIIENAMRYATHTIEITLNNNVLSIYNDGKPIDEELLDSIFEPYKKGPNGSFGLGMAIVYRIVTMYGYDICVINREQGVEFKITPKD